MKRYVLGVDGGNTKADFFLFDTAGAMLGHLRTGTCSHEALGSYGAAEEKLRESLAELKRITGVEASTIHSAVLGLAGADIRPQVERLEAVACAAGLGSPLVCNDSLLGLKAAAPGGVGICSINGTGTVVGGVDEQGHTLQVGGIGDLTSDFAGGGYLAREVIRRVYDELFRDGEPTALTPAVLELLGVEEEQTLLERIHETSLRVRDHEVALNRLLFRLANEGDGVACGVVSELARTLAASVVGCAKRLRFTGQVPVVLAGSVWVKNGCDQLLREFSGYLEERLPGGFALHLLEEPPALGAVLWAWERDQGTLPPPEFRKRAVEAVRRVVQSG